MAHATPPSDVETEQNPAQAREAGTLHGSGKDVGESNPPTGIAASETTPHEESARLLSTVRAMGKAGQNAQMRYRQLMTEDHPQDHHQKLLLGFGSIIWSILIPTRDGQSVIIFSTR